MKDVFGIRKCRGGWRLAIINRERMEPHQEALQKIFDNSRDLVVDDEQHMLDNAAFLNREVYYLESWNNV